MNPGNALISVHELHRHLDDEEMRIVDCRFDLLHPDRGYQDFVTGHIPGAVYAHLDRDLAAPIGPATGRHPLPDPQRFAETLGRWGIGNDSFVVVYDEAGGAIAARLWWLLEWAGHERVAVLDGGFSAWRDAGMAITTAPTRVPGRQYSVRPRPERVVTTAEVAEMLQRSEARRILDARAAARYRGETEPIDPVAGHIPGTRNLPFDLSLREGGLWRPPDELRQLWQNALGSDPETPWVAMCGSGVTACHLALSARVAGFAAPRLYAGSWSEWIRDPGRPVATGADPRAPGAGRV